MHAAIAHDMFEMFSKGTRNTEYVTVCSCRFNFILGACPGDADIERFLAVFNKGVVAIGEQVQEAEAKTLTETSSQGPPGLSFISKLTGVT